MNMYRTAACIISWLWRAETERQSRTHWENHLPKPAAIFVFSGAREFSFGRR